jgi:hypothetical protein
MLSLMAVTNWTSGCKADGLGDEPVYTCSTSDNPCIGRVNNLTGVNHTVKPAAVQLITRPNTTSFLILPSHPSNKRPPPGVYFTFYTLLLLLARDRRRTPILNPTFQQCWNGR